MKKRTAHPTCKQPDRDEPRLVCGYPMPCPHHTITIDVIRNTLTVPLSGRLAGKETPSREAFDPLSRESGNSDPTPGAPRPDDAEGD